MFYRQETQAKSRSFLFTINKFMMCLRVDKRDKLTRRIRSHSFYIRQLQNIEHPINETLEHF